MSSRQSLVLTRMSQRQSQQGASDRTRRLFFQPGKHSHNRTVEVGAATATKIAASVKSTAMADKFKPASAKGDEVMLEELTEAPCPALPKPVHVARVANRLRQKLRTERSKDVDFEVVTEFLPPAFLQAYQTVEERLHLIRAVY